MNNVVLIGRLTRDPEVRYVAESQMAVARFSIAVNRITKQNQEKNADFIRIVVFGRQAENCERFLAKGRLVGIQGRIQTGSYTNKDGQTVNTVEVVANNVEFLEWGDRGERSVAQNQYQSQPQQPVQDNDMSMMEGFQSIDDDIPF